MGPAPMIQTKLNAKYVAGFYFSLMLCGLLFLALFIATSGDIHNANLRIETNRAQLKVLEKNLNSAVHNCSRPVYVFPLFPLFPVSSTKGD